MIIVAVEIEFKTATKDKQQNEASRHRSVQQANGRVEQEKLRQVCRDTQWAQGNVLTKMNFAK